MHQPPERQLMPIKLRCEVPRLRISVLFAWPFRIWTDRVWWWAVKRESEMERVQDSNLSATFLGHAPPWAPAHWICWVVGKNGLGFSKALPVWWAKRSKARTPPLADISVWLEPNLSYNGSSITRQFLQNAKYMPIGIIFFYLILSVK